MSTLTDSTNLTASITLTKKEGTVVSLDTDGKYVPKDIVLTLNAQTATPAFSGGAITGVATATGTNITLGNTDNGISIVTDASANRAAITYNGAVNGWVSKSDNDTAYSETSSATALTSSTYYISEVTIPVPNSGTNTFSITIPNGPLNTITFTFTVDASGNTTIN